jgi:hypothetical protein
VEAHYSHRYLLPRMTDVFTKVARKKGRVWN